MADEADYESEGGGVMDRIKESPRTVSALIIILIVAAAIYAFSGDTPPTPGEDNTATTEGQEEEATATPTESAVAETTTASPGATPTAVTREELADQSKTFPEATKTDSGYTEVAQAGDGYTHLARRAATRWLSENQPGYTVTNEHRIFIEDYIKDQVGNGSLALGHSHTISFDLIAEAVAAAQNLSDAQLRNLSRYTTAL
jgi:hypothetical protein